MIDFSKVPYASWLEKGLENVTDLPVKSIGLVVMLENGMIGSSFYNATAGDKALLGMHIQQLALMESNSFWETDTGNQE